MSKAQTIPDFPAEITPQMIDSWREALDIDKAEAAAMLGKAATFWSKFLAGDQDLKLQQLNSLLKSFTIRAEVLRREWTQK